MTLPKRAFNEASCPVCSKVFQYRCVSAADSANGQDADFCPRAVDPELLNSYIVECPSCRFGVYQKDFHTRLTSEQFRRLRDLLLPPKSPASRKRRTGAEKYGQAVACYEALGRRAYFLATLHLRGSWCCRVNGNLVDEARFQESAVELLQRALLEDQEVGAEEIPVITYLIGELSRRLGRRQEASDWFEQVPELISDSHEQKWLVELAEQQSELNANTIN